MSVGKFCSHPINVWDVLVCQAFGLTEKEHNLLGPAGAFEELDDAVLGADLKDCYPFRLLLFWPVFPQAASV